MQDLQERLAVISMLEGHGHTQETIEAYMECYDGKGLVVSAMTEEVIRRIIDEQED